ncbi:MAG: hypothetical protein HFJ12_00270 [Bacilli bacterium]|nr:hypothetical protein [Bacilli bacterium]
MSSEIRYQKKFYDYIEKSIINNKKISHAYLIEIANLSNYMEFVNEFIKILLCSSNKINPDKNLKISKQIDHNNYPDLKIIRPDGSWIKKEQLIQLELEFSKKSLLDSKLIYVIDKAENLNDSSANTILKFLEEPEEGIIAILLTNNRYQVLDTILSRCQVLSLSGDYSLTVDLDTYLMDFVLEIQKKNDLILNFDTYLNKLFYDKEQSKTNLGLLQTYFCNCLDQNNTDNQKNNLLKDINNKILLKYIEIFDSYKEKLQYNLNLKLWLTDLLIQLMEVK